MSDIIIVFDPLVHEHLKSNNSSFLFPSRSPFFYHSISNPSVYFCLEKKFANQHSMFGTDNISYDVLVHYHFFCYNKILQELEDGKNVVFFPRTMNKLILLGYYTTPPPSKQDQKKPTFLAGRTATKCCNMYINFIFENIHLLPVDIRTNHFTGFMYTLMMLSTL